MSAPNRSIPLSHRIEYALLRLLRGVFFVMPLDASSWIMGKLWRIFAPYNVRHERALRHLEWALGGETTDRERRLIAQDMWENLGRTFIEGLLLDKIIAQPDRLSIPLAMQNTVDEALSQGAIFVGHHFGNWELNALPAVHRPNSQLMGLYKRVKNQIVEHWLKTQRERFYQGGLYSAEDRPARKIIAKIRQGIGCAMLGDLRDARGVTVRFFNMPTSVSAFPASLAIKLDVPLYAAQICRKNGAHFTLDIVKIDRPSSTDTKLQIQELTQALHTQFECWIKEDPGQWMWAPHRWRGRHDGVAKPSDWTTYIRKIATQTGDKA